MTGVAAQMCGDRNWLPEDIGVKAEGDYLREATDEDWKANMGGLFQDWRSAGILNDLSPAATFIAANYNLPLMYKIREPETKSSMKSMEENADGCITNIRPTQG